MSYFTELAGTLARVDAAALLPFVRDCQGTLWLAGNGGSASIAQHWACDLSNAAKRRVQALGSNPAVLTAWANDSDYANVFSAELSRLAQPGDRLICLSCSGSSPNIYYAVREAVAHTIPAALVTSPHARGQMPADLIVIVPAEDYGVIEDCFSAIGHWLTKELA